jgi:hypothetical protein
MCAGLAFAVAGCSAPAISSSDGTALAVLMEQARETGSVITDAYLPNSVVDGWYVLATPARPYPNATGFLLQRGDGDNALCVRQNTIDGGSIEVLPAVCPDPMGTQAMSDADAALETLVARATFIGGLDEATASPLVESITKAAEQLREEGHPLTVTKNTAGTTEVSVGDMFACRVATSIDVTTYAGPCPS